MKRPLFLTLAAALCLIASSKALEPWADERLPVKEALGLWLDAGAEERAVKLEKDAQPAVWHDASGHHRDARQDNADAKPKYGVAYPVKVMSFDGQQQCFTISAPGWEMPEATVVVFARAKANAGSFRGLLAASQEGKNDFITGFNLDLGSAGSTDLLPEVNVEGAGFRGERNQLRQPLPTGATFSAACIIGADKVVTRVGAQTGERPRVKDQVIHADQLVIGARLYNHQGQRPTPLGFFHGDIFEVLVYERALAEPEIRALQEYFRAKYAGVVHISAAKAEQIAGSEPLVAMKDPPEIHPLVPGFTSRRLPVSLPNINFLRYHRDGRLFAGAYDGTIYTLRDTDGDGLEDKAEVFYQSEELKVVMGLALTPPGYPRGDGVFVATRGRVLLILDKNGDGQGDELITVAQSWEKQNRMGGGVADALGVALDQDGSVYFTLGTSDFTNAYLLDAATGQAGYRTTTERGSVQRVSPDFTKRETVCSGIRYIVGLAFNRAGDLFATEQEGATWLANGNPFDELLHIQKGRHYGFPPFHPQHLPSVVDEPSTFDFAPQHQSSVGLAFDEPQHEGGPVFGPAWWRGDALVAAMSRGKIYRTKLVKTDTGYVAKNETFAQLQRIIIDQAVTPRGALVVTLHSGGPDWGTGPTGKGDLWQIAPVAAQLPPQPIYTWSASPTELRVAFDAPLSKEALAAMDGKIHVTQGRYVQAGDRFENMRPGYQVVRNQLAAPRFPIPVRQLALSEDARTLVLTTPPRNAAVNYGLSIESDPFKTADTTAYHGQLDLLSDLTGLDAEWAPSGGGPALNAVLPHLDLAVAREFTKASTAHEQFFQAIAGRGRLTLRGQLDLGRMLYPTVQAGSKLDWEYPPEQVTVTFAAARPFRLTLGDKSADAQLKNGRHEAVLIVTAKGDSWFPLEVAFTDAAGEPALTASWVTDRSATPRPFPLRRVLLPYAKAQDAPPEPHNEELPQLSGANWETGHLVFKATCAICHTIRGEGGKVGPDLTNLIYRDYDSVLRDIRDPNAAINPEHVAYTVTKKDGSELTAVLIAENANTVSLALVGGVVIEVPRAEIAGMKQLATSLMPVGLDKAITPEQLRDLMSYLLLPPFEPAPLMVPGAPPARKLSEVRAILGDALDAKPKADAKPLRIVLCASEKDKAHGKPGYHDYPLWRSRWLRLLGMAENIHVETATDWPSDEQWRGADVIAINSYNPAWALEKDPAKIDQLGAQIDAFLARGGGLVCLHWTLNAGPWSAQLSQRLGLCWGPGGKFRHGSSDWLLDPQHPLAAGFQEFKLPDESYWHLAGDLTTSGGQVLASTQEEGQPWPVMWTREVGPGRVFVSIPGHFTWTHDDPLYRILILRGLMWSAKQPLDRLAPLTIIGARVEN